MDSVSKAKKQMLEDTLPKAAKVSVGIASARADMMTISWDEENKSAFEGLQDHFKGKPFGYGYDGECDMPVCRLNLQQEGLLKALHNCNTMTRMTSPKGETQVHTEESHEKLLRQFAESEMMDMWCRKHRLVPIHIHRGGQMLDKMAAESFLEVSNYKVEKNYENQEIRSRRQGKDTPLFRYDANRAGYGSGKHMRNGEQPLLSFEDRR